MKTSIYLLIIVSLILGACSSSYKAGVAEYDDLYYTPRDANMQAETANVQPEASQQNVQAVPEEELSDYEKYRLALEEEYLNEDAQASQEAYAQEDTMYVGQQEDVGYAYYDDGSTPPVVNNYYGTVNQYPDYTSRIRRFHSPYVGYSYYDPYYYDPWYDPYYYSSWGPRISLSFGFGFGWGYGGWGYPYYGWGYPSYGWGYPYYGYGSYWSGYHRGYWDGYY
ncbi:MAG: hypothetical protein AMS26_18250, partial [Bacteroides sp. SM23_62]